VKTEIPKMTTMALAGWFGANRLLAETVGKTLGKCEHIVVPFAGGCCELKYLDARTIIINDRHSHVINLARVVADPLRLPILQESIDALIFHPDELEWAQETCKRIEMEVEDDSGLFPASQRFAIYDSARQIEWARAFFVACWMGRGGNAGTDGEFNSGISLRYDANGGDSNVRYRSAASSLRAWHEILKRGNFTCEDFRAVLAKAKDQAGHGIYADAPWPDAGDGYKHKFIERDQRDLAARLSEFKTARVLIRFGVHPLIEELYPRTKWRWLEQESRCQHNRDVREALICNW
jgi:site-specific DNA-adenine methylase